MLPQDTEQNSLQTVREDLRLKTSKHEPTYTRFGQHVAHYLWIRQLLRMRLLVHLDDANAVTACVTDG